MGSHQVSLYWPVKILIGKSLIYSSQVGKHPSAFNTESGVVFIPVYAETQRGTRPSAHFEPEFRFSLTIQ